MNTQKVLLFTSVVFAAIIIVLLAAFTSSQKDIHNLKEIIVEKQDSLTYRKAENGTLIAQKHAAEINYRQFEEHYAEQAKAIEKVFDIKIKEMKEFVALKFTAQGSGSSTINNYYPKGDTGQVKKEVVFNDGFLRFNVQLEEVGMPTTYTYTDSLTLVGFTKKKWFGGRREYFVNAAFENPNNKATSLRNIRIEDFKDKRIALGPYVGIDTNGKLSVGVALHYDLVRIW